MSKLLQLLNENVSKTPDEIVGILANPWQCLKGHTMAWFEANRNRSVILYYNGRPGSLFSEPGYRSNNGSSRTQSLVYADRLPIGSWPHSVFTSNTLDNWFMCFVEGAVPFEVGVHNVRALEALKRQRPEIA